MTADRRIFKKSRSHPKIPGAIRVTWSRSYTRDPQILGAAVKNLIASAKWHLRFMHLCYKYFLNTRISQMWYWESSLAHYSVLWHRNVVITATNGDTTHPATTDFYKRRMVALACHLQDQIHQREICFGYFYNFVRHVFRTSINIKLVTLKLSAKIYNVHVKVKKAFLVHTVKAYRVSSRPALTFLNLSNS